MPRSRTHRNAGAMQHYYFHITDGERIFKDEVGRLFASPGTAQGHAVIIASELASDDGWDGFSVVVEDKDGGELTRVPIHS
jgi:hypothetical protein